MNEYDEYVDGDGDEDEYANDDYLEERARSRKPSKEDEEMSHRLSSEPAKELSSALAVVATPPLISSRPSTAVGEGIERRAVRSQQGWTTKVLHARTSKTSLDVRPQSAHLSKHEGTFTVAVPSTERGVALQLVQGRANAAP